MSDWRTPGFRGRVGMVIEVGPQQFVSYRLRGVQVTTEHVQERDDFYAYDFLARTRSRPTLVRMEIEGYLDSQEWTTPPSWAEEPQGEIEATRQLPAGPTRELPSGPVGG